MKKSGVQALFKEVLRPWKDGERWNRLEHLTSLVDELERPGPRQRKQLFQDLRCRVVADEVYELDNSNASKTLRLIVDHNSNPYGPNAPNPRTTMLITVVLTVVKH